jgi:FMN phosphatase YigB (HAD superfamily)
MNWSCALLFAQVMKRKSSHRAAEPPREVAIAIGWYSLRDWQHLKRVAADSETLHATYREWVEAVEQTIATLREAGKMVEKLEVDVEVLEEWCRTLSLENTSASRARFVAEKLQERGTRF